MKTLKITALVIATLTLSGCATHPYNGGYAAYSASYSNTPVSYPVARYNNYSQPYYAAPVYPVAPRYAPAPVLQFNYGVGHARHFEQGHHDYRPEHHFSHGHHGRRHERDYH
jgi:hypothetical protein